jgi:UPF0755 protein
MFITKELDGKKFHAIDPAKKNQVIFIALLATFTILPMFCYFYYSVAINRPAQNSEEKVFEIKSGDSTLLISEELYKENLINSKILFNIYVLANKLQSNLQAGIYKIPAGTSLKNLTLLLQLGKRDEDITFIEGWRAEEIARKAEQVFPRIDYEEMTKAANEQQGYLFPDTYTFNKDVEVQKVISTMRANFDSKTAVILSPENLQKIGLTKTEAVIIASMLEREITNSEDRPIVAGILIKRYKNGELVGADATTQYAVSPYRLCAAGYPIGCFSDDRLQLCDFTKETIDSITSCLGSFGKSTSTDYKDFNWWPANLTPEEISFSSLFNTRKVVGIPPSPISNPGLASISAVVESKKSEYNYYLTDSEGITHYAKTLAEHNLNIAKYL